MINKKRPSGFISRFVFSVLRDIPETRDDWMLLVKLVHDTEMIQERNPKLRGTKWKERQRIANEISDNIVENQLNLFF